MNAPAAFDANALIIPTLISKEIAPVHWTPKQRSRFFYLLRKQAKSPDMCKLMYWNSDPWGRSSNGGRHDMIAAPGAVHVSKDPLSIGCGVNLHASLVPHKWAGARVWIVALLGPRGNEGDEKSWACKREVIGEILPEESAFDLRVGARLGFKLLSKANLGGANLEGANLRSADLGGANLGGANLRSADIGGAYLGGANLYGANLYGANLRGAYLRSADLYGANLRGAQVLDRNFKIQLFSDVWEVDPKTGIVTRRKS